LISVTHRDDIQSIPAQQRASTGDACWRSGGGACGSGLRNRISGGLGRHCPAQLRGSVRQRAGGADERRAKNLRDQGRSVWPPLSVSRRRSRDLRKTPQWSAERRAGPRYGPAIPSA